MYKYHILFWCPLFRKYGKRQFKKEILEYCSSDLELREKEALYVNQKFIEREDTYNLYKGGGYDKSLDYSEVGQRRYSYHLYKMKNKEYHDSFCNSVKISMSTPEVRCRISEGIKLHIEQYGSWWSGKKHKEETKLKIGKANSISQRGERNSQYGTMWITDDKTSLKIKVGDKIPEGWRKGRICKKVKT